MAGAKLLDLPDDVLLNIMSVGALEAILMLESVRFFRHRILCKRTADLSMNLRMYSLASRLYRFRRRVNSGFLAFAISTIVVRRLFSPSDRHWRQARL